jgi:hypothetical protein
MGLAEIGWRVWIGFDWLRRGIFGEMLWIRWWTFGFLRHEISVSLVSPFYIFTLNLKLWRNTQRRKIVIILEEGRDY